MKDKQRTPQQNRSMRKGFTLFAEILMEQGLTKEATHQIALTSQLPPTGHDVEEIFRSIMWDMYQVESTTELNTSQIKEVWDVMIGSFAIKGYQVQEWPSQESAYFHSLANHQEAQRG